MSIKVGSKSLSVVRSFVRFEITAERVEKPERRVGRVIKPFLLAIGKHVRDQSVADVMREGAQDVSGLEPTAGHEREAFQTDHGVAAPIGEPMITGDDGADFVAGGVGARRFLESAGRRDDKLVAAKTNSAATPSRASASRSASRRARRSRSEARHFAASRLR